MRAIVVLLLVGRVAGATPVVTKCYAGAESTGVKLVLEREIDRDKREIREHRWRDPLNEAVVTLRIAADGKTFKLEHDGTVRVTGTLEGPAWRWTHLHSEAELGGVKGVDDIHYAANAMTATLRTGDTETTVEAKAFDCKDLKKQIAALDDTAPDAKHACYAGKDNDGRALVVDQITEDNRVQIVTTTPSTTGRIVMAIEGAKIFVKNPAHSWTAAGTITGKPGAWTGYEYTLTLGTIDLRIEGTLGGRHYTAKTTAQTGGATSHLGVEADAFDCKDIAAKRAALK